MRRLTNLPAFLAEQARIADETGDMAVQQAFHLHAHYCDDMRSGLDRQIESLNQLREQLRAQAAQSFGRTIALERARGPGQG